MIILFPSDLETVVSSDVFPFFIFKGLAQISFFECFAGCYLMHYWSGYTILMKFYPWTSPLNSNLTSIFIQPKFDYSSS